MVTRQCHLTVRLCHFPKLRKKILAASADMKAHYNLLDRSHDPDNRHGIYNKPSSLPPPTDIQLSHPDKRLFQFQR